MIKEAAQRLLDKKQITQSEYDELVKLSASPITGGTLKKLLSALGTAAVVAPLGAAMAPPVQRVMEKAVQNAVSGMPALSKIMFPKPTIVEMILKSVKPVAMGVGAVGAAGLLGKELYDQIAQNVDIRNTFDEMREKVPQLQQYDPEEMRDYFDVVKTYSPQAASNPLVAGALVHKMMMMGGVDHKLVQDISQIERKPHSGMIFDIASASAKALSGMPGKPQDQMARQ